MQGCYSLYFLPTKAISHQSATENGYALSANRLTVTLLENADNKDFPTEALTQATKTGCSAFAGSVYRGTCPAQFTISGTLISFDKVKNNIVSEAFDRETSGV